MKESGYAWRPVWGRSIRIWHWLLLISVVSGWLLGEYRSFTLMQYHFYAGYAIGALLLVRIWLGLFGPEAVRFRSLVHSPAAILRYASRVFRRKPSGIAGHNPLGALSAIAMLISLAVQVITGLFAEDDGLFYEGPLASTISSSLQRQLIEIHHINSRVLLWLVGLHVVAILYYLIWKRENLIKAMITGRKLVRDKTEE